MSDKPAFASKIKRILFLAGVNAYDRPHAMVVGIQRHAGPPEDVEDRQLIGPVKRFEAGKFWLSQGVHDVSGFRHRSCDDLFNRCMRRLLLERTETIFLKSLEIKHGMILLAVMDKARLIIADDGCRIEM
jgi:hypothetical protein